MVVLMSHWFRRFGVGLWLAPLVVLSAGGGMAVAWQSDGQVVDITAERFSFTPSEFRVKAGQPVEIRLRSEDTDHGFHILGTDVNVAIPKRGKGVATVRFVAPQPGRHTFECSRLCGAGHSFMRGTLIAE
jgi:cytochrome c oxidase subunit 2